MAIFLYFEDFNLHLLEGGGKFSFGADDFILFFGGGGEVGSFLD